MKLRLQSPQEIRLAARRRDKETGQSYIAEVLNNGGISQDGAVEGGLYCERAFGSARDYDRRRQMGLIELPWPCAHVWFTGNTRLGRAAKLLDKSPSEVFDIRQYAMDVYLGEWTAAQVWSLRKKYGLEGVQVPAVGSPVAATPAPALCSIAEAHALDSHPVFPGGPEAQASVTHSVLSRHMPLDSARMVEAVRRASALVSAEQSAGQSADFARAAGASARLRMELQGIVVDAGVLAGAQPAGAAAMDPESLLPHLVKKISMALEKQGMQPKDVDSFLARLAPQDEGPGSGVEPPLRMAAQQQQDLHAFWQALTVPGFEEDFARKLQEIRTALEGGVASYDVARVIVAVRRLQARAHAALGIALESCAESTAGDATKVRLGDSSQQSAASRFSPQAPEVCWYRREMEPASFHLEDVERLWDRSAGSIDPGPRPVAASERARAALGLGHQAAEAQAAPAETASAPSEGLSRPRGRGRAGPAGALPGMPASLEAEGSLFIGSGGAGVRQVLCSAEPLTRLRQLYQRSRRVDAAMELQLGLGSAPPSGVVVDTVRASSVSLAQSAAEVQEGIQARVCMFEAALSKFQFPEWMVFLDLPVLPPDLRLRSARDPEEFPDDLNVMYKEVLKCCRNLESGLAEREPGGLLRYHKAMLQVAVDQLIDNGRVQMAKMKRAQQPLESVAMRLKSKRGRLRKNMLGKRVDYSARTVIVVEPKQGLDECGMPYMIARDLFRPFLIAELRREAGWDAGESVFGRAEKKRLEEDFDLRPKEERWELLSRVMKGRRVVLNRAPTLHRLSMQAFQPHLVEGQALKIHPLVCSPFNADFDGDTMTMHLGLGEAAQRELAELMAPSRNLSSPASGDPVIGPSQDMVLGIYYLTVDAPEGSPSRSCSNLEELDAVAAACAESRVSHTLVLRVPRRVLVEAVPAAGEDDATLAIMEGEDGRGDDTVVTTAGRVLFFLLVHGRFQLGPTVEDELLGNLDAAPLAPVLA